MKGSFDDKSALSCGFLLLYIACTHHSHVSRAFDRSSKFAPQAKLYLSDFLQRVRYVAALCVRSNTAKNHQWATFIMTLCVKTITKENVNRSMFLDTCDSFHTQIINKLLEPVTATLTSVTLLLQNWNFYQETICNFYKELFSSLPVSPTDWNWLAVSKHLGLPTVSLCFQAPLSKW